ncbi:DUF1987 domain-containing protein [Desulfosporosinus sp. SYSU MS00001]|uniref:DUF1987 domain-containing protein n=1 Tax=Desulfosporosinus sp. SYSU MS00001 TaxID=3416284 RepID=UPI003CE83227
MERLFIKESKSTPLVDFDSDRGLLVLKGQSYPEDPFAFFKPIIEWVKQYLASNPKTVSLEFTLTYINTSSSKCIMMLLDVLEESFDNGLTIDLKWFCNEENEYEQECAQEFQEDYTFPFEIVLV